MFSAIILHAGGGFECDFFPRLDGNLLSRLGIETCTLGLLFDEESAEIGNGNLLFLLGQCVCNNSEDRIYHLCGVALAASYYCVADYWNDHGGASALRSQKKQS